MLNRLFACILAALLFVTQGCSKQEENKEKAKEAAHSQPVVLELGNYQLTQQQMDEILDQLPLEQKAKYMGRGQKGREEFLKDFAEKQMFALAARDRKLHERPRIRTGMEMAQDSVLYSTYYREEVLDKAIPESEIRAYYEQNKDKMVIPEQVKIRQIFVSPRPESEIRNIEGNDAKSEPEAKQKIDMLVAEINKGADFSQLAMKWSEDPNAPEGGEMPWFGRGRMVKAFEDKAFSMEPGRVSDPVKTDFGYYLIHVVEKRPATPIAYEEVRDQIQNQLASDRADLVQKLYEKVVSDLQTRYPKKVHPENLTR